MIVESRGKHSSGKCPNESVFWLTSKKNIIKSLHINNNSTELTASTQLNPASSHQILYLSTLQQNVCTDPRIILKTAALQKMIQNLPSANREFSSSHESPSCYCKPEPYLRGPLKYSSINSDPGLQRVKNSFRAASKSLNRFILCSLASKYSFSQPIM